MSAAVSKSETIWAGKILRVNLSRGSITEQPTSDYLSFAIGGRGIGQWILFREVDPQVDPYDPENILTLGAGPLVGTPAPASSRLSVDTKNALTGGVCASNAGGHFAPELKWAGYDSIVITGQSDRPVYLWIHNGHAELRDASHLWGRDTWDTETAIREELGDQQVRLAVIGPAGENLVRGACLIVDRARAAGRGGAGAVMGSKRLKAVAVRGTGTLIPADGAAFMREVDRCNAKLWNSSKLDVYRAGGSMRFAGAGGPDGNFPQGVRNYQDSYWPLQKSRKIYEPALKAGYEIRRLGCFNCSISCSHFYNVREGPYAGSTGEGFEINSGRGLGSNLDIDYPPAIIETHNYCSRMGLDVDMAAACMGFAFEAYNRGDLSQEEANGLDLAWGNHKAANELLHAIVERKGIGDLLAEGVKRASQTLGRGSEAYALHVKGADLNEASMRPMKAWSLAIILSTHGGGHLDGAPGAWAWQGHEQLAEEIFGNPKPGAAGEYHNQSKVVIWHENYKAVIDMLGICYFTSMWIDAQALSPDDYASLLSTGSGRSFTGDDLMGLGRNLHQVQKAFNTLHTGHSRVDDHPPRRATEPAKSGPFAGERLDPEKWEAMLDEYYRANHWDLETGWQTAESLRAPGLDEIAVKLDAFGRLKP
jgi:aldehyde:ferredoxin oxidoreductase